MKLIIAGSRKIEREKAKHYIDRIFRAYFQDFTIQEVIHGGNGGKRTTDGVLVGVDLAGKEWAEEKGYVTRAFYPDWEKEGKKAGPMRNQRMAKYAGKSGGLILIWDGVSRGSANMLKEARTIGMFIRGVKITI